MTPRLNHLVVAGALAFAALLTACGSDSESATTTVAPTAAPTVAPTAAPAETTAPPETTAPVETSAPVETAAPIETAAQTTVVDGPVVIEVDADSGTPIAQTVALGTDLSIRVITATAQEWHLHGYDVELEGTDVTFQLTATQAGEFELESHETGVVVLNLTVTG